MKLINIGFGNMVSAGRLVAIVSPESAPIKRIIQDAKDRGTLIDATYGRRTRAVLITDSDHVILSAVQPETVANRLNDRDEEDDEDDEEECYATTCPECEEEIFFDDSVLEDGKVECPNCGATLEFDPADLVEDEEEKDD